MYKFTSFVIISTILFTITGCGGSSNERQDHQPVLKMEKLTPTVQDPIEKSTPTVQDPIEGLIFKLIKQDNEKQPLEKMAPATSNNEEQPLKKTALAQDISNKVDNEQSKETNNALEAGRMAIKNKDYAAAFQNFRTFTAKFPKDVRGPLYCAQAASLVDNYEDAMAYYKLAATLGDDSRINSGVSFCSLALLEKAIVHGNEISGDEREAIVKAFEAFRNALITKDFSGMTTHSSLLDAVYSSGCIPLNEDMMKEHFKVYLGFLTMSEVIEYVKILQINKVVANSEIAKLKLVDTNITFQDTVYLRKINGAWRIAFFTTSILGRGK